MPVPRTTFLNRILPNPITYIVLLIGRIPEIIICQSTRNRIGIRFVRVRHNDNGQTIIYEAAVIRTEAGVGTSVHYQFVAPVLVNEPAETIKSFAFGLVRNLDKRRP